MPSKDVGNFACCGAHAVNTSLLCGKCEPKYHMVQGECEPCTDVDMWSSMFYIVSYALFTYYLFHYRSASVHVYSTLGTVTTALQFNTLLWRCANSIANMHTHACARAGMLFGGRFFLLPPLALDPPLEAPKKPPRRLGETRASA